MTLSQRELRLVFEGTREGILVVEPPLIVDANPAVCSLLGYRHKQLVALPGLDELICRPDRPTVTALLSGEPAFDDPGPPVPIGLLNRNGDAVPCDLLARRSGRTWFLTFRPVMDRGEPGQVRAPRETGRRTVLGRTRELEESRNRYRQIVEGLADGLVTLNERGEFLFVNKAFPRMLGYKARSRLVAREFLACVVDRDRERVARGIERWSRGEVARFEASLKHDEGGEVAVLLSGRAMEPTRPPGPPRILLLITDFAERQALSERLALARKMDALSSLAGGIAHDFNNLLTGILGNASRIRIGATDPEVDELARAVEDSAELAARLTQRLMTLVRGQAPHRRLLDVGDLVEHTVSLLGKVLPDSIRLETAFEQKLDPVLADESQLQQAVLNLCINARDAMMDCNGAGTLSITVRQGRLSKPMDDGGFAQEPAVELTVSDTGPGIPKELRDRIFDPFFTTKGLGRGIGLGLATVYQLVDAHGGTVVVDEAPGGGALFALKLPAQPGRHPAAVSRPSRTTAEDQLPGVGTILLAEDEKAIRELVASSLRTRGYEVLAAADGDEAASLWQEHGERVDLLFLDVRMPGLDGPEVLRLARDARPEVPAIFSSGFIPDDPASQEVFEQVLYLPKPYRIPELIGAVRTALEGRTDPEATSTSMTPLGDVETLEEAAVLTSGDLPSVRAGQAVDANATILDHPPVGGTKDLD